MTDDAIEATPCVIDGTVYVGSLDGFLYAVKDGGLLWKYETDGAIHGGTNWVRSPDGGRTWILVGSDDCSLHCVDAAKVGADIATIPYGVFNQMMNHPLTDLGMARFIQDWEKALKG